MADLNSMEFKAEVNLDKNPNMLRLGYVPPSMTKAERIKAKLRAEAPKEVDAEGKEINAYVPKFIADAPWYMADDTGAKASLVHQKYVSLFLKMIPDDVDIVVLGMIDLECNPQSGTQEAKEPVQQQRNIVREHVKIAVP
jgi:hypothetical protein